MDVLRPHSNEPTASFDVLHNDKTRCHTKKKFYESLLVKLLLSSAGIHNPTEQDSTSVA